MATTTSVSEHNLLFGVLALRAKFIDVDTLQHAVGSWMQNRTLPLGEILRGQGKLSVHERLMIDAAVEERLSGSIDESAERAAPILPSASWADTPREGLHCTPMPKGQTEAASNGEKIRLEKDQTPFGGGHYRILQTHAKGGLGEIFLAEDIELKREVALKEIQREKNADKRLRKRFVNEARITGRLEHPGVVPIHCLGTHPDGRSYYVMRLIKGANLQVEIERFHNQGAAARRQVHFDLAFRQLLHRFLNVCNTVAYAHSRDVLHRDLKPENIMLGEFGETLVVDWGLAKTFGSRPVVHDRPAALLNGDDDGCACLGEANGTLETHPGAAVGTPAYMSPEQAAGQPHLPGPASDVYGLGATLYTMLTGQAPFTGNDRDAMRSAVQRGEFAPPRQINARVPAALERICLKAMATDPEERYSSVQALASDVERFLADETVSAYREPWFQRIRRWLRKHRTLATSAVAMLVVAVLLSSGAAVLLNVARTSERQARLDEARQKGAAKVAEQAAQQEKERAEAVSQFLVGAFRSPNPKRDGREIKFVDVLEFAVANLDQTFVKDPATYGRLLHAFGKTYEGIGMFTRAVELLTQARDVLRETLGADHDDTLGASTHLSMAHRAAGNDGEALQLVEEIHQLYKAKLGADHPASLGSMGNLAQAYAENGRPYEALPLLENVFYALRKAEPNPGVSAITQMTSLASTYKELGRLDEALALHEEAYTWRNVNLGKDHLYTLRSMLFLAWTYHDLGRLSEAIMLFEEALESHKTKFGADHPGTLTSMNGLAVAFISVGKAADAIPLLETSLQFSRTELGPDHWTTLATMTRLAIAYREAGRHSDALPLMEETLQRVKGRNRPNHPQTLRAMCNFANICKDAGRLQEVCALLEDAALECRENLADTPLMAVILANLGRYLNDQGLFALSETHLRTALDILARKQPGFWLRYSVQVELGVALAKQQKYVEAEPVLIAGYEGLHALGGGAHPRDAKQSMADAVTSLIALFEATAKPHKVTKWRQKLLRPNR